jgi:hypothetical protein
MPSINVVISPLGPIVDVAIGVTAARRAALIAAQQPVPPDMLARLLIDTGASNTNICGSVINALGIVPTNFTPVHTPSTGQQPVQMPVYDAKIVFHFPPSAGAPIPPLVRDTVAVIGSDFTNQGIQGLLGRDMMRNAVIVYHGDVGLCSISY